MEGASARVKFWEEAITTELLEKVRRGDLAGMREMLLAKLKGSEAGS
jgi:hypothetical protein